MTKEPHEEMFNILNHKGNANQNNIEIPSQEWLSSRKQMTISSGEVRWGVVGRNPHTLLVGM
jgi:hypothetical protein